MITPTLYSRDGLGTISGFIPCAVLLGGDSISLGADDEWTSPVIDGTGFSRLAIEFFVNQSIGGNTTPHLGIVYPGSETIDTVVSFDGPQQAGFGTSVPVFWQPSWDLIERWLPMTRFVIKFETMSSVAAVVSGVSVWLTDQI